MKLEIKKKLVINGQSRIFNDWNKVCRITEEDFLLGLTWLHSDYENEEGRLTKELGCDPDRGLIHVDRAYNTVGMVHLYESENKQLWNKYGTASISTRDRI